MQPSHCKAEKNLLLNYAMQQVADGCTFHKIPKSYITLGEEDYDKRYTAYLQNYGISLDDYLEQYADRATYNQEKATDRRRMHLYTSRLLPADNAM